MIRRELVLATLIAACLSATACTHWIFGTDSAVDENWGIAYEQDIRSQIADPDAPASVQGPEGIDASTAERVADRYYKGQESQQTRRPRAVMIGELQ